MEMKCYQTLKELVIKQVKLLIEQLYNTNFFEFVFSIFFSPIRYVRNDADILLYKSLQFIPHCYVRFLKQIS